MKTYTIMTESTIIRTYKVEANSADEAAEKFNKLKRKISPIFEDKDGEEVIGIEEC